MEKLNFETNDKSPNITRVVRAFCTETGLPTNKRYESSGSTTDTKQNMEQLC